MPLPRNCKHFKICGNKFTPATKSNKVCPECMEKTYKERIGKNKNPPKRTSPRDSGLPHNFSKPHAEILLRLKMQKHKKIKSLSIIK